MKKYAIILSISILVLTIALSAYALSVESVADPETKTITGTIQHFTSEGDFYGIEGDDGVQYKPMNLSSGFEIEGLRVKAKVRFMKHELPFGSWHMPVDILEIQKER